MVRVSSPAKLRPWSELTARMVMGVVPGLVKLPCDCRGFGQLAWEFKNLVVGKNKTQKS